ncbi:cholinephosphate cytidylyltransferase [Roridomyces roridus]|uniref:choline-phosphate cytidylyltransferase n=1 Tax=Roridomyces roridus TaxID=1738132 RepID=A0AAD7BJY4_9AGAR|nr:cholinephosphate cytidylyltransferase [Roridomyces roridus]
MDASVLSDDSDYDIVSPDNSIADLGRAAVTEPPPSQAAQETFNTCRLTAADIQNFVQSGLSCPASLTRKKRIYVDGTFDGFNVRHALQLRQAKLAFPSVWLIVGVFSAESCELFGTPAVLPEVDRCEVVRHCRWVDEVMPNPPCTLDVAWLHRHKIDYVAIEQGATVDPAYHSSRVKGYDELKRKGSVILTRRTTGVTVVAPTPEVADEEDTPAASRVVVEDDAEE